MSKSTRRRSVADRQPRRHRIADWSSEKLSCTLRHAITALYSSSRFAVRRDAKCWRNVVVSRLVPTELEKTSGVNEACSTALTRSSNCRCFWHSCRQYAEAREERRFDCTKGWKTLMSKNVQSNRPPPQNPLAQISGCASSSQLAVPKANCSPPKGWSSGSIATSEKTSEKRIAR